MLEHVASLLAVLGALLVTSPVRTTRLTGFFVWLFSNTAFLTIFLTEDRYTLAGMHTVFLVLAAVGVIRNARAAA